MLLYHRIFLPFFLYQRHIIFTCFLRQSVFVFTRNIVCVFLGNFNFLFTFRSKILSHFFYNHFFCLCLIFLQTIIRFLLNNTFIFIFLLNILFLFSSGVFSVLLHIFCHNNRFALIASSFTLIRKTFVCATWVIKYLNVFKMFFIFIHCKLLFIPHFIL